MNQNPKPIKYKIERDEETDCNQCGYPLYVGDTAYLYDDAVYCGKGCIQKVQAQPKHGLCLQYNKGNGTWDYASSDDFYINAVVALGVEGEQVTPAQVIAMLKAGRYLIYGGQPSNRIRDYNALSTEAIRLEAANAK